jgi:hypothetical protein
MIYRRTVRVLYVQIYTQMMVFHATLASTISSNFNWSGVSNFDTIFQSISTQLIRHRPFVIVGDTC